MSAPPGGEDEILRELAAGRLTGLAAVRRLAGPSGHTPAPAGAAPSPLAGAVPARPPAAAPPGLSTPPPPDVALAGLDRLIGLEGVKETAREIYAMHAVARLRRDAGLAAEPTALHMVFRGPPGTGKTTVARAFGQALRAMGALERGHLVEVERADLVGEYVGHTAQRTREAVTRALGGVLFVDEAYALARGGEKDFGREAIDTLVRQMEENRSRLVVVLAGYPREMDAFLATNPGLSSRIPIHLEFRDYSLDELVAIALGMFAERGYRLTPEAEARLPNLLVRHLTADGEARGNARAARNLVERALRRHAVRVLAVAAAAAPADRALLSTIQVDDLRAAAHRPPPAGQG